MQFQCLHYKKSVSNLRMHDTLDGRLYLTRLYTVDTAGTDIFRHNQCYKQDWRYICLNFVFAVHVSIATALHYT